MRARALLVAAVVASAALLASGCAQPAEPAPPQADEEPARTARGGRDGGGEEDNRTFRALASANGGPLPPGSYPLPVQAPAGGAIDVEWLLEVVPVAAFTLDGVTGPGCETNGWYTSVVISGTMGGCAPVPEGAHDWGFTLNAPVASYRVEVVGRVWSAAQTATNATEP